MNKKANKTLTLLFLIIVSVLSIHFFNISLIHSDALSRSAASQRTNSQSIKKWRGCIYDCNMIPLTDRSTGKTTAITGEEVDVFSRYDEKSVAGHVLGYTFGDGSGAAGLEKAFDSILHSDTSHSVQFVSDAAGNPIDKIHAQRNSSFIPTNNIKLTLDYKIQKIADNAADKMMKSGAIVIMDCRSFDIKAMVSRPAFDQNNIVESMDKPDSPLLNKAINPYNAGSIFKIVTTAAAIENNTLLSEDVLCTGKETIDGKEFLCHKQDGHQKTDFVSAFANSCNCYYYRLARKCGGNSIITTAQKFGLGTSLCTDILADSPGTLPYRSKYSPRECANIAIGQGEILITPLQAAYMTAIIANNGIAGTVNIADSIVDADGTEVKTLRKYGEKIAVSKSTAMQIANMMLQCTTQGTASAVQNGTTEIAGKTGTAQTGWYTDGMPMIHGWFCGFFPYDNPKYAMAVFCENGQSGSAACIPIFKEIVLEIDKLYN